MHGFQLGKSKQLSGCLGRWVPLRLPQLCGISQGRLGPALPLEAREMQGSTSQPTLPLCVPAGESCHLLNLFPHLWGTGTHLPGWLLIGWAWDR